MLNRIKHLSYSKNISLLMLKESAMEKWFKFEMTRVNSGLVTKKMALSTLAEAKTPKTEAKDGSVYYFNKDELIKLKKELPEELHSLRLPIFFYISLDVRGSVYVADKPSLLALKHLGEVPNDAELTDGRYWLSKVLVMDMMKRRPTISQFVRY